MCRSWYFDWGGGRAPWALPGYAYGDHAALMTVQIGYKEASRCSRQAGLNNLQYNLLSINVSDVTCTCGYAGVCRYNLISDTSALPHKLLVLPIKTFETD